MIIDYVDLKLCDNDVWYIIQIINLLHACPYPCPVTNKKTKWSKKAVLHCNRRKQNKNVKKTTLESKATHKHTEKIAKTIIGLIFMSCKDKAHSAIVSSAPMEGLQPRSEVEYTGSFDTIVCFL